ncbi:GerW family sporulation protein [Salisediminibacterium halotolerans]|uniref:Sporulation protein YtfJ (Spore_YtfJ) n=1 Tax=Salisediminibacterium halotolerans TaxID=517425 RepID=A0A1H9V0R5_9BACI|nr:MULTISPECIES: spore germination protein GerW family protein [Salisediminibacterium]RLJ71709.1 sporulation protein YtfJ [Actinophytocola xinjiangensis]RPE86859.1 sporulation protein YtfJ [Salisediminibacterium halotolerans]TWG32922.1 sporulation protein YtfJ [Salisediminibacterium halotolerans]SES15189.1 Sporulation protein YtfJ (Spore_YtfJ) [Salisediminibacterium haloalkalitolerans]GEL07776.1 hypothetical protein SHA02_11920 [Salisediminibacterium halotolerans]
MREKKKIDVSLLNGIFDKFASARDVSFVYGDPITLEHKTILPVAKVKYSVGAGSGYEQGEDGENDESRGEGGGGQFSIKPVGVYDITSEKTTYKPVVPVGLVLFVPIAVTAAAMLIGMCSESD